MYRHHPLTLAVKQKIEDGAIGDVRYARSTFSTGLTDRQNWRLRGDLGGGAVMDLGCYCINIIRYLIGQEPQSVWATGKFEPINNVWETLIGTLGIWATVLLDNWTAALVGHGVNLMRSPDRWNTLCSERVGQFGR